MMTKSELIERAALLDLHKAAAPELRRLLGLDLATIDGTLVSIGAGLPSTAVVINRAIGLGTDMPPGPRTVVEIAMRYQEAGVDRYFVHGVASGAPAEQPCRFGPAGLDKARGWQKFRRNGAPVPQVETDLEIIEIGPDRGAEFARIVCGAFDLGEIAEPWLAQLPGRPGWHVFMSLADGEPAGVGALFVCHGLGWTDWGATAPAFRCRGSQSAILAARIRRAYEVGCAEIFNCTGEAVPGDPQHSYGNITKLGFEPDVLRTNFAPALAA